MSNSEDKGILSRWSRRKHEARTSTPEARETEAAENDPSPAANEEAGSVAATARKAELEANREAAEAVDLENVGKTSDFSIFLKEGVPVALRKKALAALWRSDPIFANLDGLNDHDEDYTNAKLVPKVFKSAWETGRGYLKERAPDTADEDKAAAAQAVTQAEGSDKVDDVNETASSDVSEGQPAEEDTGAELLHETGSEQTEDVEITPDEMPRVSLRRRLSLDEST